MGCARSHPAGAIYLLSLRASSFGPSPVSLCREDKEQCGGPEGKGLPELTGETPPRDPQAARRATGGTAPVLESKRNPVNARISPSDPSSFTLLWQGPEFPATRA